MKNFRKLGTAFTLSMLIGASMVTFSPTLHAAGGGSAKSVSVRCALLEKAIAAVSATLGADSDLALSLQAQYDANCAE